MTLTSDEITRIGQLYAAYNHAVDNGDGKAFASCFVAEGSLDVGTHRVDGAEALMKFAAGVPAAVPGVRHILTNLLVEGEGSTAHGRAYLMVLVTGAEQPRFLMTGRYHDALVQVEGTWRFVSRIFVNDC